jgi:hypothetical protein
LFPHAQDVILVQLGECTTEKKSAGARMIHPA